MNIGYQSTFMDKIIERADKRQERMEKMIDKMLDKSEKILQAGMTNEQWFCSLSTEEKAEWLTSTFDLCGAGCGNCFVIDKCNNNVGICPTDYITAWLKEVHKE